MLTEEKIRSVVEQCAGRLEYQTDGFYQYRKLQNAEPYIGIGLLVKNVGTSLQVDPALQKDTGEYIWFDREPRINNVRIPALARDQQHLKHLAKKVQRCLHEAIVAESRVPRYIQQAKAFLHKWQTARKETWPGLRKPIISLGEEGHLQIGIFFDAAAVKAKMFRAGAPVFVPTTVFSYVTRDKATGEILTDADGKWIAIKPPYWVLQPIVAEVQELNTGTIWPWRVADYGIPDTPSDLGLTYRFYPFDNSDGKLGMQRKASVTTVVHKYAQTLQVADRYLCRMAMEFDTDEALKKYMDEHPKADPKNHWVKDEKYQPKDVHDFVRGWKGQRNKEVEELAPTPYKHTPIQGKMTKKHAKAVATNMQGVLKSYAKHIPDDDLELANSYIQDMTDQFEQAMDAGEFKDVDAERINTMMMDTMHALAYQTHESFKRSLGDHGIRHIMGNINIQNQIFDALDKEGKKISPRQRILGTLVHVNHDLGYTAAPAIADIKYTGKHKEYSGEIFGSELEDDYRDVFGDEDTDRLKKHILTHDSDEIDWDKDPVGSAVRVSDNLSLYSKEKLPGVFRLVPKGIESLEKLAAVSKEKPPDEAQIEAVKKELHAKIDKAELEPKMKQALKNAANEIGKVTSKHTVGMLGGQIDKVQFQKGTLHVKVKRDPYEERLQKMFDLGQRQFKKLAEAYGHGENYGGNTFDFKKGDQTVLHVDIE